jgi:hypothetical protein
VDQLPLASLRTQAPIRGAPSFNRFSNRLLL